MDREVEESEYRQIREFKKEIFSLFWEKFGTFYIHILPHPSLEIGKRGLTKEEKEGGIILVFGPRAIKGMSMEEDFLFAELQFGYRWEKLVIPWDAIFRFFDKDHNTVVQSRVFLEKVDFTKKNAQEKPEIVHEVDSNVIQVKFGAKKNDSD